MFACINVEMLQLDRLVVIVLRNELGAISHGDRAFAIFFGILAASLPFGAAWPSARAVAVYRPIQLALPLTVWRMPVFMDGLSAASGTVATDGTLRTHAAHSAYCTGTTAIVPAALTCFHLLHSDADHAIIVVNLVTILIAVLLCVPVAPFVHHAAAVVCGHVTVNVGDRATLAANNVAFSLVIAMPGEFVPLILINIDVTTFSDTIHAPMKVLVQSKSVLDASMHHLIT